MDAIETYEHNGVTVQIFYDESGENPREMFDHVGTIVSFTREFDGDEYISSIEDMTKMCPACDERGTIEDDCGECGGWGTVTQSLAEYIAAEYPADEYLTVPLRFSDYGSQGGQLYESDQPNALIYAPMAKVREEWGDERDAHDYLLNETAEMNSWMQGEVYGYIVDPDGDFDESCWGFIGDMEYVKAEANEAADYVAERMAAEKVEREEMAARDIVTL